MSHFDVPFVGGGGGEVTTTKEVKFKAHRLEGGGGGRK